MKDETDGAFPSNEISSKRARTEDGRRHIGPFFAPYLPLATTPPLMRFNMRRPPNQCSLSPILAHTIFQSFTFLRDAILSFAVSPSQSSARPCRVGTETPSPSAVSYGVMIYLVEGYVCGVHTEIRDAILLLGFISSFATANIIPSFFHCLIVDYKGSTQDVDFPHSLFDRFHHVLIQPFPLLDFLGMRNPAALSSPSLRHTKAYLDTG